MSALPENRSSRSVRELDPRDQSLAAAVQSYLERCPDASDTARGIQEWWLPGQHRDRSLRDIERILWAMVEDGRLLASALENGAVLFARNPAWPPER
jgi:hypothetical protein